MAALVMLVVAFHLTHSTYCEPTINFPINSQLPPVARIDDPFSYTFSRYTFRSDSKISYSLGEAPQWLSIDSEEGRLYGTPTDESVPEGEVVGQTVVVIAEDDAGSASLSSTLVISRSKGPSVKIPLTDQIQNFGDYSAPSSLISYPSTEFSLTFDRETFGYRRNMINYYATSGDSSPLPAWMRFDAGSLTFSGKTPPFESLIQPPQTFDFDLVASDIVGFSAVSVSFSIIVGRHKLTADNPTIVLNTTRGKKLAYDGLADTIKLDNKAVDTGEIEVSTDNLPGWLSLDEGTWEIEGTAKEDDHSTNFTIDFRDSYEDTLTVEVFVNVATSLFRSTFDDIEIRAGEVVNIDLEPYFWDPDDVNIEISVKPDSEWLQLDGFNITGKIPRSASGELEILVQASSKSADATETEALTLSLLAATPTPSSTSQSSTSTASKSTSTSAEPTETTSEPEIQPTESNGGISTGSLLLAILLPLLVLVFLLMLLICCLLRRRRARQTYLSAKFRNKISGPVLESLRVNGSSSAVQESSKTVNPGAAEQQLYRPARRQYSEMGSETLTISSPTLGAMTTPEVPPRFIAEDSTTGMSRSVSMSASDDGRQSWITVEGTVAATGRRSQASLRSQHSDTTFPESTHQLIPPPVFLSESRGSSSRSRLDLTIPSLEDLPNRQAQRGPAQPDSDFYSSGNDSSLAFPSSHQSSPRLMTGIFPTRAADAQLGNTGQPADRRLPPAEGARSILELMRPELVRLSSQQLLGQNSRSSSPAWYDTGLLSDPSFGSTENWRVLGRRRDTTSLSYRQLVDEAPFHPARLSTAMSLSRDEAQLRERASSELISPSQWDDTQTSIRGSLLSLQEGLPRSMSRFSRLSVDPLSVGGRGSRLGEASTTNWRREDSAKKSEGGSFKAFL